MLPPKTSRASYLASDGSIGDPGRAKKTCSHGVAFLASASSVITCAILYSRAPSSAASVGRVGASPHSGSRSSRATRRRRASSSSRSCANVASSVTYAHISSGSPLAYIGRVLGIAAAAASGDPARVVVPPRCFGPKKEESA
eukprot:31104-Pelagococcus_subviridis.AAC.3